MGNYYDDKLMEELRNKQKKFIKSFLNWCIANKQVQLISWHSSDKCLTDEETDKLINDYINRFKVGGTHG